MSDMRTDTSGDLRLRMLARSMQDRSPGMPASKGQRLYQSFLRMIERGAWRPGEQLPPERDLAEALSLSLGTVQGVLRMLTTAGLLDRRQGAGTFITKAGDIGANVWHFRFRTRDGQSLMPFDIGVRSVGETAEQGEWSEFLGGASHIAVDRVIDIGGEFRVYSRFYLDAARFRPLLDLPAGFLNQKNLRVFLHESYNAPTLRGVHRLNCRPVAPEHAALIDCRPGEPGIYMTALGYTFRDAPISFQHIVIPSTDYELEILG